MNDIMNEIPLNELDAYLGWEWLTEAHPDDESNLFNTVEDQASLLPHVTEAHACGATRQVYVYVD